jgi:hypothetical protein
MQPTEPIVTNCTKTIGFSPNRHPSNACSPTSLREIDEIVPCIIILRRFRCLPQACLIRPSNGLFLCFSHVVTIGGRFCSIFGGFHPSTMTHPVPLGRFFSLHEAFAGTIVMPYVLSMLLLHISMLDFTFILRVAAAMSLPSDIPGQHRRAFITNMQVPIPIVSINAFVWCSYQDSITDFYVLPRFSAADRHYSSTTIFAIHHFAV